MKNLIKKTAIGISAGAMLLTSALPALADSISAIDFESPMYTVGDINGQQGWMKTGGFDVEVASVSSFPNASGFGFDDQALRISNAVTSGSFGDQTFSPSLSQPASESGPQHFEASFEIGSTMETEQPGLFLSVSPDDGQGSRMSYVGFDDEPDGIHVMFYDVTNAGPLGATSTFNGSDVATIDRDSEHTIKFTIDLLPGPGNDVVDLYVDGALVATGGSWEDYYRYDPEQNGNGNIVPSISNLIFLSRGTSVPANAGNGYLIDHVSLSSGPVPVGPPTSANQCLKNGWKDFNNPTFKNQGKCVSYVVKNKVKDIRKEIRQHIKEIRQEIRDTYHNHEI